MCWRGRMALTRSEEAPGGWMLAVEIRCHESRELARRRGCQKYSARQAQAGAHNTRHTTTTRKLGSDKLLFED